MINLRIKPPFARIQDGWPIPEALIVFGKRKQEIRPIREENKDAYRIYSEHKFGYLLILDVYFGRIVIEWTGWKWHDA